MRAAPARTVRVRGMSNAPDSCYVLNIGDSRTYHLSRGADGWDPNTLYRITHDHSQRQEAIDSGRLLPQEALSIPATSSRSAWAIPRGIHPDIYAVDCSGRFIACSDGLHGEVDDAAIARIAARYDEPQEAADALVHVALLAGGRDNVSVVVVDAPSDTTDGVWQAVRAGRRRGSRRDRGLHAGHRPGRGVRPTPDDDGRTGRTRRGQT